MTPQRSTNHYIKTACLTCRTLCLHVSALLIKTEIRRERMVLSREAGRENIKIQKGMRTCAHEHKDNRVRQEKFWMDGAERPRRCKEWSAVNNLEAAV